MNSYLFAHTLASIDVAGWFRGIMTGALSAVAATTSLFFYAIAALVAVGIISWAWGLLWNRKWNPFASPVSMLVTLVLGTVAVVSTPIHMAADKTFTSHMDAINNASDADLVSAVDALRGTVNKEGKFEPEKADPELAPLCESLNATGEAMAKTDKPAVVSMPDGEDNVEPVTDKTAFLYYNADGTDTEWDTSKFVKSVLKENAGAYMTLIDASMCAMYASLVGLALFVAIMACLSIKRVEIAEELKPFVENAEPQKTTPQKADQEKEDQENADQEKADQEKAS